MWQGAAAELATWTLRKLAAHANKDRNVLLLVFFKQKKKEVWFSPAIYNSGRATVGQEEAGIHVRRLAQASVVV